MTTKRTKKETAIQNEIKAKLSSPTMRVFRNETGMGYGYSFVKNAMNTLKKLAPQYHQYVEPKLRGGIVKFGFGKGSSDLIGIKEITITPEMVGKKIGQFVAIETKKPDHNTEKERFKQQTNFIDMIKSLGGIAGFADSLDDARRLTDGN